MSRRFDRQDHPRVVVLGGGIAALECVVALHDLANGTRCTIVAPDDARGGAGYRPFARPATSRLGDSAIRRIADAHGAVHIDDSVAAVSVRQRRVLLASSASLDYDHLIVAVGANEIPVLRHCWTANRRRMGALATMLQDDIAARTTRSVLFVAPPGAAWTLPLYEMALLTRTRADSQGFPVELTLITTESAPLALFGPVGSERVAELLDSARIGFVGDAYASTHRAGRLTVRPHRHVCRADAIVALPRAEGPHLAGLPQDAHGFLPTDPHGRVRGAPDVYAAGDCTAFPVKQGGLAAQQADAVAQHIAHVMGHLPAAEPFDPVLYGKLVAGRGATYLRHRLGGGAGGGEASADSLWSPPLKLRARYLAPWLTADPVVARMPDADLQPRETV